MWVLIRIYLKKNVSLLSFQKYRSNWVLFIIFFSSILPFLPWTVLNHSLQNQKNQIDMKSDLLTGLKSWTNSNLIVLKKNFERRIDLFPVWSLRHHLLCLRPVLFYQNNHKYWQLSGTISLKAQVGCSFPLSYLICFRRFDYDQRSHQLFHQ